MPEPVKPRIYAVATTHLDTSWSWELETTLQDYLPKTLTENFELLEKYPDYVFSFEGAYRYELMEEYYPELFEKLERLIAAVDALKKGEETRESEMSKIGGAGMGGMF